jgi:hypothetical protein
LKSSKPSEAATLAKRLDEAMQSAANGKSQIGWAYVHEVKLALEAHSSDLSAERLAAVAAKAENLPHFLNWDGRGTENSNLKSVEIDGKDWINFLAELQPSTTPPTSKAREEG